MKQLREGQKLTVVELSPESPPTVTVEDEDGELITFDIDPRGLPRSYEGSTSDV